jgi:hypothetical protein
VDVSADALKTAHSMADARRAELAAKLRARYLARLPASEAPTRADALTFPERWKALDDFATLGTFPQTAVAGLMSGLPEVRGLPRVADWHPVLDHVPVTGLDAKVKAAAKDTQQFARRMLRVLMALDELVADDKQRILLDSAAVLLGAFTAAQLDMTTEHLLARAKAGRPMDTSAYFAKVRALAKTKAAPALGSQLEELQDWADMIDHRLLGRASATASSATSVANAQRDRRRRTKRGPGGVVVPVSAAQTANPATASPARQTANPEGERGERAILLQWQERWTTKQTSQTSSTRLHGEIDAPDQNQSADATECCVLEALRRNRSHPARHRSS